MQKKKPKTAIKKSSSRAQYPPEIWTTIRALYESGQFKSMEELHKHCKKIISPCPSIDSLRKKSMKEEWDKHDQDEQKTEEKKRNFIEQFAKLGMDDKKAVELIIEGMHAGGDIRQNVVNAITSSGGMIDEDIQEKLAEYATHLKTRKYYLELFCKLTGAFAPEKMKIVHKDGDLQKKTKFSELPDQDLHDLLKKLDDRMRASEK